MNAPTPAEQEMADLRSNPAWGRAIGALGKHVEDSYRSLLTFTRPPIDPQTLSYESGRYHGVKEALKMLEEMAES
jgi:hypothetical protein